MQLEEERRIRVLIRLVTCSPRKLQGGLRTIAAATAIFVDFGTIVLMILALMV